VRGRTDEAYSTEGLVSVRLCAWRARSNVSSDVGHGGITFFGDAIDVFVSREV